MKTFTKVHLITKNLPAILAYTRAAIQTGQKFTIPYTNKRTKRPSLLLVKDEGAYLMANTTIRQIDPKSSGKNRRSVVAYFKGFEADKVDFARQQAVWGGDDFALDIDMPKEWIDETYDIVGLSVDLYPDGRTVFHWDLLKKA